MQPCKTDYDKKCIKIPRNPTFINLYSYCHEIGHAINVKKDIDNSETNAWNIAYDLCLDSYRKNVRY